LEHLEIVITRFVMSSAFQTKHYLHLSIISFALQCKDFWSEGKLSSFHKVARYLAPKRFCRAKLLADLYDFWFVALILWRSQFFFKLFAVAQI